MVGLRLEDLIVSEHVLEKLETRHRVFFEEVEEVVFGAHSHIRRGRQGLQLVYGRTEAGRYLFAVLGILGRQGRIITARDMTRSERRFYARQK